MADSNNAWAQVTWPIVLRYGEEPALSVVASQNEWDLDPDLHTWPYQEADRIIDSGGVEFRLVFIGASVPGGWTVEPTGTEYAAAEFQRLVESHLEAIGTPAEWLRAYLEDFQASQRVRAAVQYITRISKAESPDLGDEEEEE